MLERFLPLVLAIIFSYIMTPIVRKLAFKIGAIDIPKDNKRIHKEPMPLIGGLAIYIAVLISTLIFLPMTKEITAILIGATVILISGIIDDKGNISPMLKVFFQLIAASILIYGDVKIEFLTNPFSNQYSMINLDMLSIPATLIWVVAITNALNLIDGLDGLAAGVSAISSFSFMLVGISFGQIDIAILSMIVMGACLGFLPFNFNPAKIFMGDTGALFLGFMLAAITIEGVMKSVAAIAVVVPIFILGVPIFDTTFAIFRRLKSGRSITAGDRGHLHHRLLERGYSQRKTVLILYGISALFGSFAVLVTRLNTRYGLYFALVMMVLAFVYGLRAVMSGSRDNKETGGQEK